MKRAGRVVKECSRSQGGPAPLQGVGGKETLEGLRADKTGTLNVERAQVRSCLWNLQKGTTGPNPPKAMEPP